MSGRDQDLAIKKTMEHRNQTDQAKQVKLPSQIERVAWTTRRAMNGALVGLEILTHFVGNRSELEIELSDQSGKSFGKFKERLSGNRFWTKIKVPSEAKQALYADVKLPKQGLQMKSSPMIILPAIEITNLNWSQDEARDGDLVKLSADVKGAADGESGEIEVWEYDSDGAHDFISRFPIYVKNNKVEAEWEYEYHEDRDEIPTQEELEKYGNRYNPPEYFFKVNICDHIVGNKQESKLLAFRDWFEILLTSGLKEPISDEPYVLYLPDGKTEEGKTSSEGRVKREKIQPGKIWIEFPCQFSLVVVENGIQVEGPDRGTPGTIPLQQLCFDNLNSPPADIIDINEDELYDADVSEEAEAGIDDYDPPEAARAVDFDEEKVVENPGEYKVANIYRVSGAMCHLAVMGCIIVCILTTNHELLNKDLDYILKDKQGNCLAGQSCDSIIYQDMVGIGEYELTINNQAFRVASSDNASDIEYIVYEP